MALAHAFPGQPIDVRPLGPHLADARTVALFKSTDLEVMRIVLLAGKALPPHAVGGEITIQCLEGLVDVGTDAKSQRLTAGELMYLARSAAHSVTAIEDSSLLVTVALGR
jgi:quercetin dioxygenase-like cupin family protein